MTLVTELLPDVVALQLLHPEVGATEAASDGAWDTWHLLQAVRVKAEASEPELTAACAA